jgi:hypothetical protein
MARKLVRYGGQVVSFGAAGLTRAAVLFIRRLG